MKSRILSNSHHRKTSNKKRVSLILTLASVVVGVLVLQVLADAPPGPYFNGFEVNTSGWLDTSNGGDGSITREQSGYTNGGAYASGINSAMGQWHARVSGDQPCVVPLPCSGPFTRWGGYSQEFPNGGYRTQIDIYLDVDWAATHPDARFDFSSSISRSDGTFLRDFVFNAGTNRTIDPGPAGFFINASTNATRSGAFPENTCPNPSTPPNVCRAPVHITTSGWYTFRHTFRDDAGFLAVDFDIFPSGSTTPVPGGQWTIHSGDNMSIVGGNRYGWFANEEIPDLAIDDSLRTGFNIDLAPATATNIVGTNHTVTATISSTDTNGHPAAGAGQLIEFDVVSGPNAGQTSHPLNSGTCSPPGDCTTDAGGQVSWTYMSNGTPGTDTIQACFPERSPVVERPTGDEARQCRTVTKVWEAESCATTSSIMSNFNGTSINPSNYIWFNANFNASGIQNGTTISFTNSKITIVASNNVTYMVTVPDATITFSSSATCATTTFSGQWMTTVPVSGSDEIFLSGLLKQESMISGNVDLKASTVTWTGSFGTNTSGVTLKWKWGAAVYQSNSQVAAAAGNPNQLGVKPTHTNACNINNSDHAGTPEAIKKSVIGGARGGGGSNFTGSWSGTQSMTPCVTTNNPPAAAGVSLLMSRVRVPSDSTTRLHRRYWRLANNAHQSRDRPSSACFVINAGSVGT